MTCDALKVRWALAILVILSAVIWGPTIRYGFVWDDEYFVVSNTALREWSYLPRYFTDVSTMVGRDAADRFPAFRAIRNITYLLDFKIAGLNPAWWHFHNVVLHTLNAVILMLIARRVGIRGAWPVLAAAIFLVHPVQTETVAWVKGRDDLLGALFSFLAFACWLGKRGWKQTAGVAALYLLACLSKDQCVSLPLALVAWRFWQDRRLNRDTWISCIILGGVGLLYLVWRQLFLGQMGQGDYLTGNVWTTLMTMTLAAVKYLQLTLIPAKLIADYSGMVPILSLRDPLLWVCVSILAAVAWLTWWGRKHYTIESFGAAWAAIMLLPMSNIVPMMQFMAERFLYLPLAGFALAMASLLSRPAGRASKFAAALAVALVASYGARAALRVPVWKDSRSLFAATVRDTGPETLRPRRQYLDQLILDGLFAEALPFARDLHAYIQQHPTTPRETAEITRHLGYLLAHTGDEENGKAYLKRAIDIDLKYVDPYIDLGVLEGAGGSHQQALAWFDNALQAVPGDTFALYNRGIALNSLGQAAEAEDAFRQAMTGGYESRAAHRALVGLLWSGGRREEAAAVLRDAAKIWPDDAEIRRWLAEAEGRSPAP